MPKATSRLAENEPIDEDTGEQTSIGGLVRSGILAALGRPPCLFEVAVRVLWDNHYRVNVLTGSDVTTVKIAHSYFVRAGVKGEILSTTPKITRLYA